MVFADFGTLMTKGVREQFNFEQFVLFRSDSRKHKYVLVRLNDDFFLFVQSNVCNATFIVTTVMTQKQFGHFQEETNKHSESGV